ncbi:DUF1254 domain-containing protein [Zavarzinia compransoris]|uniref:DUF1254 domain-containing protein n=1 Tax=Zavarzinia compransoris TaxID=1264899 RepID=A0A317DY07_9PROT|nr:DUF1254 domain-containing protein [Zavarzinia compransoris]PWR18820.1 DUF1254 domain-containing protein [Zavarzinia compransoris]TDP48807.1 putative membrane protein [Zavarzinia compransoris]
MTARLLRRAAIVLVVAAVTHVAAVWALPRLIMSVVIDRAAATAGGPNRPLHPPAVDDTSRWVVLPSPDLRYSSCALDLRQGPVEVSATPPESYFSLSVFDAITDNVFVISNATTGSGPIRLVIAGPDKPPPTLPEGARLVTMPTETGLLLLRALAATPELAAAADEARRTLVCKPLA